MLKSVLVLAPLAILSVSCGSKGHESSATMGSAGGPKSLKSDVELFDYLSSKKSKSDCKLTINRIGGSAATTFKTTYSYELAAQNPGTTGESNSDWNSVFLESNFKMNLVLGNSTYANSIKINRDMNGTESLEYVIHTQVVTSRDHILIPVPVAVGGGKSLQRSSGKILFSANGDLKSIQAKREVLENKLLGKQWKIMGSVVECGN